MELVGVAVEGGKKCIQPVLLDTLWRLQSWAQWLWFGVLSGLPC